MSSQASIALYCDLHSLLVRFTVLERLTQIATRGATNTKYMRSPSGDKDKEKLPKDEVNSDLVKYLRAQIKQLNRDNADLIGKEATARNKLDCATPQFEEDLRTEVDAWVRPYFRFIVSLISFLTFEPLHRKFHSTFNRKCLIKPPLFAFRSSVPGVKSPNLERSHSGIP